MASFNHIRRLEGMWAVQFAGQPSAGDSFTVNDQQYTFIAGASSGRNINVAGTLALTLAEVVAQVNGDAAGPASCTASAFTAVTNDRIVFVQRNHGTPIKIGVSGTNLGTPIECGYFTIGGATAVEFYIPWCSFVENYFFVLLGGTHDTVNGNTFTLVQGSGLNGQEVNVAAAYNAAQIVNLVRGGPGVPYLRVCTTAPTGTPYWKFAHGATGQQVTVTLNATGHDAPTQGSMK